MKKLVSCRYGILAVLIAGLSGCFFDGQEYNRIDYTPDGVINTGNTHTKAKAESSNTVVKANQAAKSSSLHDNSYVQSSKGGITTETKPRVAPGPKRTAAPQLPVIE
ncbi:MAG: hypothetical protein ACRC0B_03085 [Legionella sp.]